MRLTSLSKPLLASALAPAALLLGSAAATRVLDQRAERLYPDEGGHIEVEGVRLRYTDTGAGRPVVLIHGLLGSAYDFDFGMAGQAAERYRLIAFDRPGSGYSEADQRHDQSPFRQATLLRAAVERLGLERPVLVGYSLGAPVAMAWAELYPDDAAAVVSVSGHVMPYVLSYARYVRYLRVPSLVRLAGETVCLPYGTPVGHWVIRLACFPQPVPPGYARAALAVGLRPHSVRHAALDLDLVCSDLRLLAASYGSVRLPVVVVGGAHDRIAPFTESEVFHRRLPNARLVTIPDGGHALHVTHPAEVVKAIDLAVEMSERLVGRTPAEPTTLDSHRHPPAAPATEQRPPLTDEAVA